ncbi:imidazole glycerol phosphate synthase subunit HisH [Colwelliaceae bacterium 6441]
MVSSTPIQQNIVIVDTGCANLSSVKFAVERLGYHANITDDLEQITAADKVIFPGVGTAKHAMQNIVDKGLVDTLQNLTQPVLGFCLGMQLMTESSLESNDEEVVNCLNLIPTNIRPLNAPNLRLPHMGWNTLTSVKEHPVFKGINVGDYFYFVHSFAAPISEYTVASCQYGTEFSAAIAKDNFIGCQFHPERSSELGSKIIQNFLALSSEEITTL